jgi:UDP-N-acetylmuramate dehydrogenase
MSADTQMLLGSQYCSYRVGGPLDLVLLPTLLEEACDNLDFNKKSGLPLTILGGGSNTIIASQGIRGTTFIAKRLMFIEPVDETHLKLGAGLPLAKVCKIAQERNLSGAEFMIGVPGTLGGAIAMNAGAMGQDTASILDTAFIYNLETQCVEEWSAEKLNFSYRMSAIDPKHHVVLGALLKFEPAEAEGIAKRIQASLSFRQVHHPKEPNGGSVFKNPSPDKPCGRLLDELGAKTWSHGGAKVSAMHANFIVNTGQATSTDILELMLKMQRALETHYGLAVSPENRFIGEASVQEAAIWKELTRHGH